MAKIIGIINTRFTPKDSDTEIEGKSIHITEPIPPERGKGESTDHFFLTKKKLADLDFTPDVGNNVEMLYNRYGKVGALKLLDDDAIDFG